MWTRDKESPVPRWKMKTSVKSDGFYDTHYECVADVSRTGEWKGASYYAIVHIYTIAMGWHFASKSISKHFITLKKARSWAKMIAENPPDYIQQMDSVYGSQNFEMHYAGYLERKETINGNLSEHSES